MERRWDDCHAKEQVDAEVDEIELDEHRRAAEYEHVKTGEPPERCDFRLPHQRGDEPEHDADELGRDRDVHGRPQRLPEHVVRVEQALPDEVPVDRGQHHRPPI